MALHLHLLQFYTCSYIHLYLYRLLLTTTSILLLPLRPFHTDYSQPSTSYQLLYSAPTTSYPLLLTDYSVPTTSYLQQYSIPHCFLPTTPYRLLTFRLLPTNSYTLRYLFYCTLPMLHTSLVVIWFSLIW